MKYVSAVVCVVILCLAMTQVAVADDPFPPPWHGEWSQTFQYWEFNTEETGQQDLNEDGLPDGLAPTGPGPLDQGQGIPGIPYEEQGGSPGYLPSTNVVVYPSPPDWMATDTTHNSDRVGIWSLSGSIDVTVDNHDPDNEFKWVWVQITWAEEFPGDGSVPKIDNLAPGADPAWPVTQTNEMDWGDGWKTTLYEWRIYPNPEFETFTIGFEQGGGILVDQLVIDTWCIPEPTSLALLALGALAMLRRRPA